MFNCVPTRTSDGTTRAQPQSLPAARALETWKLLEKQVKLLQIKLSSILLSPEKR